MIRHILFNRWKPGTPPEAIHTIFEKLSDFPQRFPEIKKMELHRDAGLSNPRGRMKNYDFAIVLDFDTEANFQQYMGREHHHEVVATYIKPHQEEAARIQFLVD
jgi:predicted PolB exonuclease-like 3'-5' exonuclease